MPRTSIFTGFRCWYLLIAIILGSIGGGTVDLHAAPLEQWHWRNPLPQGNSLNNVVFLNGTWLAVGDLGTILTSNDGTNWVRQETGALDDLRDCAYGAGIYVVVGDFGTVLTSTDGIEWTQQYAGTFYALNGITYANGQFVAVGEQTTILTSSNGADWVQRSSGNWVLFDVIQAAGMYVAVGGLIPTASSVGAGVILTSTDARKWVLRVLTTDDPFNNVAYGNGQFAAAGGSPYAIGGVWTSDDAVTWQAINAPGSGYSPKIFYAQGRWLFADGSYYGSYGGAGTLFNSTNLSDWVITMTNAIPVSGIASTDGRFIASHFDGTFSTSSDGLDWSDSPPGALPDYLRDLEYINGSFCAVGNNQIAYSTDGVIWSNLITLTNTGNLTGITYGKGLYVAGGEYRTVWISANGLDWTNPAPNLSIQPYFSDVAVAYGNGLFVGVAGYEGDVLTSPDGLNWTVQQLNTNVNSYLYFADVKFGNGRFVAVGNGSIATSIDGTNWNLTSPGQYLSGVACGNETFVAVGGNTIMTSKDGTNWTAQTSSQFQDLSSVAFGGGFFAATEAHPTYYGYYDDLVENLIWVSPDGIHWSSRHSNTSRALDKATFGNGTFVLVGQAGAVLQSDPLVGLSLTMQPAPQLSLSGPVNRSYQIEYVTCLGDTNQWTGLTTLAATNMPATFVDLSWTNSATRLYRAVLLP